MEEEKHVFPLAWFATIIRRMNQGGNYFHVILLFYYYLSLSFNYSMIINGV